MAGGLGDRNTGQVGQREEHKHLWFSHWAWEEGLEEGLVTQS